MGTRTEPIDLRSDTVTKPSEAMRRAMYEAEGKLTWPKLLSAAIKVAQEGFVLDSRTAWIIKNAFNEFPDHAKAFYGKNGKPVLQRVLVNSRYRVHEGWSYDNWNEGTYGHAVYFQVPSAIKTFVPATKHPTNTISPCGVKTGISIFSIQSSTFLR